MLCWDILTLLAEEKLGSEIFIYALYAYLGRGKYERNNVENEYVAQAASTLSKKIGRELMTDIKFTEMLVDCYIEALYQNDRVMYLRFTNAVLKKKELVF